MLLVLIHSNIKCSVCGVKDPSWLEIQHFVNFLDVQLQSCEDSVFMKNEFVGDVMSGIQSFVVKFMIRMSKVSDYIANLKLSLIACLCLTHLHIDLSIGTA